MKRITQKLMIALALSTVSMPVLAQVATPTSFAPALTSEQAPLRFFSNFGASMLFNGAKAGYAATAPESAGLANAQLSLGLVYNALTGLDVGFGLHGGIFSPYGLFATPTYPLNSGLNTQYGAMFGADIMVRYLAMFSDMFYGGAQAQIGYNYTDTLPGGADKLFASFNSKATWNSAIPVIAGLVFGVDFKDAACVYLFPAIELGQTSNRTNSTNNIATSPDTGIWKSAVGMQMAVGTAINLGATKLVIEAKPRLANFSNTQSWGVDATFGAFWDF